jgi:hypothetical protein
MGASQFSGKMQDIVAPASSTSTDQRVVLIDDVDEDLATYTTQ